LPNAAKYGLLNRGGECKMDAKIDEVQKQNPNQTQPLIRNFNSDSIKSAFTPKVIAILIGVIVVGVLSGFLASQFNTLSTKNIKTGTVSSGSSVAAGTIIGSNDTTTFKDTAQGTLQEGGIDGEGAFHLVRPGGDSQNVYLTSSSVDLSQFVGKNIKVWGATQKAQHAGWLMDVGRIQVL
jgi:hypothetical protein